MKLPLFLLTILTIISTTFVFAKDETILVKDVKFSRATDDWIVAMIKLDAIENHKEDARDKDYIENIKVTLTVAYEPNYSGAPKGQYDFYRSDLEIIAMKAAAPKHVYFALPGIIVKRDRLDKDPFAWMVELEVDGEKIEATKDHISDKLKKGGAAQSFITKANTSVSENENLLVPSYLAPEFLKFKDQPDYIRKDVE